MASTQFLVLTAESKPTQTLRWRVSHLVVDPTQPRREFLESSLAELAANMAIVGQLCPVIGYVNPNDPTQLMLVDGERRYRAALRNRLESLDAIVLSERPDPDQLLLVQISINQFREQLSVADQCAAYTRLLSKFNLTQAELAAKLGVSPSKICKALARDRLASELQPLADRLEATIVPLIAKLPPDQQRETMTFATTANEHGRLPTREQVAAFIKAKFESKATARTKTLAGCWDHRTLRISLKANDTHDTLIESLKGLINFVQKNRNVPLTHLDLLLSN